MTHFLSNVPRWPVQYRELQLRFSPSIIILVSFLLIFSVRRLLSSTITEILSKSINAFLYRYKPIRHIDTGESIPTCPYQWPNGQGNVAKFLEGEKNRDKWSSKYGRIYRIWSGTVSEVVLTRPEHVQAVFRDSDKHRKAVNNNSGFYLGELLGQCVGLVSGKNWKTLKSVVDGPFQQTTVTTYVDLVEQRTRRYLTELSAKESFSNGVLDPVMDLKMLPFWVVSDVVYGTLSPALEQQLVGVAPRREELFKHAISGGITRFWFSRYLPLAAIRELWWFKSAWVTFNEDIYRYALSSGGQASICQMFEAVNHGTISEQQLFQTLDEMLFANLDVTMGGLSWNLVFLAANPTAQNRLRQEISEHRGENSWKSANYLLKSSSYLNACILESSRLKPLAPFSVPQSAPTDRIVDGFRIPAGTNFIIDSYALNTGNPFWQPDPSTYRPERFLEKEGPQLRYNYWRFGFGPRQCMGRYLADMIIRILLVEILEDFQLSLPIASGEWSRVAETWISHPEIKLNCVRIEKQKWPDANLD